MGQMQGPQLQQQELEQRGQGQDMDMLMAIMQLQEAGSRRDLDERTLANANEDREAQNLRTFISTLPYVSGMGEMEQEALSLAFPNYAGAARTNIYNRNAANAEGAIDAMLNGVTDPKMYGALRSRPEVKGFEAIFDKKVAERQKPAPPVTTENVMSGDRQLVERDRPIDMGQLVVPELPQGASNVAPTPRPGYKFYNSPKYGPLEIEESPLDKLLQHLGKLGAFGTR